MKHSGVRRAFCLLLCLCLCFAACAMAHANSIVTQTTMVRVLRSMLETTSPPGSEYNGASPNGGGTGSLGFAQTLFFKLFSVELSHSDNLDECAALSRIATYDAGDGAPENLAVVMQSLRFGDLLQYGQGGHIATVLGLLPGTNTLVVYDCGFGGGTTVRLRFVTEADLAAQIALSEQDRGGALFYHFKNLPAMEITLSVMNKPETLSYYLGSDLSMSGISLEYVSTQSGKQTITDQSPDFRFFASSKEAGNVPVVLVNGSAITFLSVEIKNETVTSLKVSPLPLKTQYYEGEALDMSGAVVTATLKDGTQASLTEGDYTLSYDFSGIGPTNVTLSFGGKTATFSVTVVEPPVVKFSVVAPTKTEYYAGERIAVAGGSLLVDYETKTNVTVPLEESMLSLYDTNTPGTLTVTVNYGGKTGTFTVTVLANNLVSLRLNSELHKEYRIGTKLGGTGISLICVYQDGSQRSITAAECTITINGEETSELKKAGTANIVFTYDGVSTGTIAVTVTEDPFAKSLTVFIVIIALLLGIPLIVILILRVIRQNRQKKLPPPPPEETPGGDDDVLLYDPAHTAPSASVTKDPTIKLPDLTGKTSLHIQTSDDPTISFEPLTRPSGFEGESDDPTISFAPFLAPDSAPEADENTRRDFDFYDDI